MNSGRPASRRHHSGCRRPAAPAASTGPVPPWPVAPRETVRPAIPDRPGCRAAPPGSARRRKPMARSSTAHAAHNPTPATTKTASSACHNGAVGPAVPETPRGRSFAPFETVVRDQHDCVLIERTVLEVSADPAVDDLEVLRHRRRVHRRGGVVDFERRWRHVLRKEVADGVGALEVDHQQVRPVPRRAPRPAPM